MSNSVNIGGKDYNYDDIKKSRDGKSVWCAQCRGKKPSSITKDIINLSTHEGDTIYVFGMICNNCSHISFFDMESIIKRASTTNAP